MARENGFHSHDDVYRMNGAGYMIPVLTISLSFATERDRRSMSADIHRVFTIADHRHCKQYSEEYVVIDSIDR